MQNGEMVVLTGMTAEVIDLTGDGRPAGVRFSFSARLERPPYHWVKWEGNRYVPFDLPPVGGSAQLPGSKLEF
jgi:hypothetical protein